MRFSNLVRDNVGLTFLGQFLVPLLVKYRNDLAIKEIGGRSIRLLDIGGEKGYLSRTAKCSYAYSLDGKTSFEINAGMVKQKPGYFIERKLPFADDSFDCVTMIAFAEHLIYPKEVMREVNRVLRSGGKFIVTTPLPVSEVFIDWLDKGSSQLSGKLVKDDHQQYFDLLSMNKLLKSDFKLMKYQKFELGVNQLFVYTKIAKNEKRRASRNT